MRVLITGGAGFLGSHVCAQMKSRGHEILVYDAGVAKAPGWLKIARIRHTAAEVVDGDILDTKLLTQTIQGFAPEVLINLAAKPGVSEAQQEPQSYLRVNVQGVESVLEACGRAGLTRIVHASSSSVYGHASGQVSETSPLKPAGQYGLTKVLAEEKIREAARSNGLCARILRPFTIVGPMGRPDMAPWIFAECILRGGTINLHAGARRDFTSVHDVAAAFAMAAERPWDGCETYNIGAGSSQGADALAICLADNLGRALLARPVDLPSHMPRETWANISKASLHLGWQPHVAFTTAIREFAAWFQAHVPNE